jgi:hypothetical protein
VASNAARVIHSACRFARDARILLAGKITQSLEGDQPLVGNARIDESKFWGHELTRRDFSISGVRGEINKALVGCVGKTRALIYTADVTWTIPASWSGCRVAIFGEPNTEFNIIEYSPEKVSTP